MSSGRAKGSSDEPIVVTLYHTVSGISTNMILALRSLHHAFTLFSASLILFIAPEGHTC